MEGVDIMNLRTFNTFINSTVSISDITKAGAKKIFDTLKVDKSKIILKNNKPIAALLSIDRYEELLEAEENLYFMELALQRSNNNNYTSLDDFLEENGISKSQFDELDDIELE